MNKTQKKTLTMLGGLLAVALVLFGYQNFIMPSKARGENQTIYVAAKDIPSDTILREDMLEAIQIGAGKNIEGAITNPGEVIGKRLMGGLLDGEVVSRQRMSDTPLDEGTIYVKVEPDYPVDLADGEFVQISHQSKDENNPVIKTLFEKKTIYSTDRVVSLVEGEANTGYYVMLTNDEMKEYYKAKSSGLVILNKISGISNIGEVIQNEPFQSNESTNQNQTSDSTAKDSSNNLRYNVVKGDSFESIADDLGITEDELKELNPNVDQVEEGSMINIPK